MKVVGLSAEKVTCKTTKHFQNIRIVSNQLQYSFHRIIRIILHQNPRPRLPH